MIVSVDPSINTSGVAVWRGGQLHSAKLVQPCHCVDSLGARVETMVDEICDVFDGLPGLDDVVVEFPRTYGGRAARGDANDLFLVAAVAGGLAAHLGKTHLVLPTEWGAPSGKGVTEARCREDLSPEELARVELPSAKSLRHNVFDSIAIGLWWLKREGIRRR